MKKKRAASEDVAKIALEDLVKYFDVPMVEASRNLKIGLTVLKRKCREFGIPRWPHRKIKSLDGLIRDLQVLSLLFTIPTTKLNSIFIIILATLLKLFLVYGSFHQKRRKINYNFLPFTGSIWHSVLGLPDILSQSFLFKHIVFKK